MLHLPLEGQIEDILPPPYAYEDLPPKYSLDILPNQQWESNTCVRNFIGLCTTFQVIFMIFVGCFESFTSLAMISMGRYAGFLANAIALVHFNFQ